MLETLIPLALLIGIGLSVIRKRKPKGPPYPVLTRTVGKHVNWEYKGHHGHMSVEQGADLGEVALFVKKLVDGDIKTREIKVDKEEYKRKAKERRERKTKE